MKILIPIQIISMGLFCRVFGAITGLSFSSDTVYGLGTALAPQFLVVKNTTTGDLPIDSIRLLPHNFSLALGYRMSGGGLHVLAFGDSSPWTGIYHQDKIVIRSRDSLAGDEFMVSDCFCLLKRQQRMGPDTAFVLSAIFRSGLETDTVVFLAKYYAVGAVETASGTRQPAFTASPNPFYPGTRIIFSAAGLKDREMALRIHGMDGKLVQVLKGRTRDGRAEFAWDGKDGAGKKLCCGVYVGRIMALGKRAEIKLFLAK